MIYSNLYLNRNQITNPLFVILPVSFIIVLLFGINFLFKNTVSTKATKKTIRRLEILNIGHQQATIFWQTADKEKGWIIFGDRENSLNRISLDERDTTKQRNAYRNHYVILKDLEENKIYYFKIISNNQIIDNGGRAFSFKTGKKFSSITYLNPAYGKVINKSGTPLNNGVVIMSVKNCHPLGSLIKISGEWSIPLNYILREDGDELCKVDNDTIFDLEIFSEESEKSSVKTKLFNLSPLPQTIIIGQDYLFLSKEEVLGLKNFSKSNLSKQVIDVLYPKDNSIINDRKPLIKGYALPNSEVFVSLKGKIIYSFSSKTNQDGEWKVILTQELIPDSYILEFKTKDIKGNEVKIYRRFTIGKSGESVLGEATESAIITNTPTPTLGEIYPTNITTYLSPTIQRVGLDSNPFFISAGALIIMGIGLLLVF